jgi:formate dehydrogenase subunit gamma
MSSGAIAQAKPSTERQIERYNFAERFVHWINAMSYTYCLLTGLALFTPYLYWLASVFGGGGTIRYWHPWIGLVYTASILQMHRLWRKDMVLTDEDRLWLKSVEQYAKNEDDKMPPQNRFNAGQKQFYWVMFYCTIVLLLTGIVMWLPEYMPRNLHWVLPIVVFLHSATALITIAGFMIHVYMSVWITPGSVKAMVDGHVSEAWAKTHHRLWYQKITGRRS